MADQQTQTTELTQTQVETTPVAEETTLLGTEVKTETTEVKAEEKKEEAKPVVPEKYEIKAPEGMEVDSAMMEKFAPIFKELNLTNEQAQKLADAYAPYVKAQSEAQRAESLKSYQGIVDGWKADSQKEFGNELPAQLGLAAKAIDKLGTKEEATKLREVLNETGLGNHPSIIRFFVNAGKRLGEDTFAEANTQSNGDVSLYDHADSKANLK